MAKGKGKRGKRIGRPRKAGERLPSGRLKADPNARVIAERRRLLGDDSLDVSLASNPLDLAHARGWLTTPRYRTAMALGDLHRRAGFWTAAPARGGPVETSTSAVDYRGSIGDMTREEITAAFDHVFNRTGLEDPEADAAAAMKLWKDIRLALGPLEAQEIDVTCIHRCWPGWVLEMVDAPVAHLSQAGRLRRRILDAALDKATKVMVAARARNAPRPTPPPPPARVTPTGPLREESTRYVDQDGKVLLEVVRRTRQPAA
jgi:hypothetical protein